MRFFNTAGPVNPEDHYCIPPLERFDLEEVLALVRMKKYFVLHAPRQTGKTSALLALCDLLNRQGYACVYTTVETARTARDDVEEAMRTVLAGLGSQVRSTLGDEFLAMEWSRILAEFGPSEALREALKRWSEVSPKPLVLLIDEIDTLQGDPLLSTLQQLRGGYPMRPGAFPQCVVLCGLRDVRDYRIRSTSSPFNIVAESLRLGDFTQEGNAGVARPAYGGDGAGVHGRRPRDDMDPDPGPAVAGERTGLRDLLQAQGRARPLPRGERGRHRRGARSAHRAPGDASRPVGGQAPGRPRAPGGRADAQRGGRTRLLQPRRRVRARPRPDCPGQAGAHRQPHLRGGPAARAGLGLAGDAGPEHDVVRGRGRQPEPGQADGGVPDFFRRHSEHWKNRFMYEEAWPQILLQAYLHGW